jgi:maltose-binding protein MalE
MWGSTAKGSVSRAITWLDGMYNGGPILRPVPQSTDDIMHAAFENGDAAMDCITGPWALPRIRESAACPETWWPTFRAELQEAQPFLGVQGSS